MPHPTQAQADVQVVLKAPHPNPKQQQSWQPPKLALPTADIVYTDKAYQ